MYREIRLKSVLAIGTALLVSVAGKCTDFNFDVDAVPFGIREPYSNPYPNDAVRRFLVTPMVNCTSELAQSQGGNGSTCSFPRYPMGIIVSPQILNATYTSPRTLRASPLSLDADTKAHIFSLVQAANPPNITSADFNATIVVNYTTNPIDEPDFTVGKYGAYAFSPTMICYNGTLSGCDSSDRLEGFRIQACGYEWIDDQQHFLPTDQQQYKGYVSFYLTIQTINGTVEPQPPYAEAAGNATVNQIGMSNGNSTNNNSTNSNSTNNNSTNSGDDPNKDSGDDNTSEAWMKGANFLALMALVGLTVMNNYL